MNLRHKLLQNLVSGFVRSALVVGTLTVVANLQASSSDMRDGILPASNSQGATQNFADNKYTLLADEYASGLDSLPNSIDPDLLRRYLSTIALHSVNWSSKYDVEVFLAAKNSERQSCRFNGVIERLRDYVREAAVSWPLAYSKEGREVSSKAMQIFLRLNDQMSRQATASMNVLNRFIEPFLQDPVHEVAYVLMNESFASASDAPGVASQDTGRFNFFINYLVYGIGLEKVGKDKILNALENTLASGDVNLSNFAYSLLDVVFEHIFNFDLVDDNKIGWENAQMIQDALESCVIHRREMVKNVSNVTGPGYDMYVPFVKNWAALDGKTINKIKDFVLLILRYYSGQLSCKITYEGALGHSSVFAKTPNDVLTEIKKCIAPQSNIESPSVEYFKDLPEKVRDFMRPYIMSILYGVPGVSQGIAPKDLDEAWNKIQLSSVAELKRRVQDINIDNAPNSISSITSVPASIASVRPRSFIAENLMATGGRVLTKDFTQARAVHAPEVPNKKKIEAMKRLEKFMSTSRVDTSQLVTVLRPELTDLLSKIVTSDQLARLASTDPDLAWQKCKDVSASMVACFDKYGKYLEEGYNTNAEIREKIPSEIRYFSNYFLSREERVICLFSEFIDYYLEGHPMDYAIENAIEVIHSFMWNVSLASVRAHHIAVKEELNPVDDKDMSVFMSLIKYLVHGVCLNTIGAEKILDSFYRNNLLTGRVCIKDFGVSLCGLIGDTINECDSEEKKFEKLAEQIQKCFDNCCELTERCSVSMKRRRLQVQNCLVRISSWHHVPHSEPDRISRFLKLVLDYYDGDDFNVMKLSDLPGNVAEAIRPYIMLILKGDPGVKYEEDECIKDMTFVDLMNDIDDMCDAIRLSLDGK